MTDCEHVPLRVSLAREAMTLGVSLARDSFALGIGVARERVALRICSAVLPPVIPGDAWALDFSNPDFSGLVALIFEDF